LHVVFFEQDGWQPSTWGVPAEKTLEIDSGNVQFPAGSGKAH
jgi:hypothetical protein